MTISIELEAQILRYFHVEKWRIRTIANQLHIHHSVVERVLAQSGVPKAQVAPRGSACDVFLPFVLETLAKYPRLAASRLYAMVSERGYRGGSDHFRHWVALHRPRPAAEAYLRLRTLPGEQAQVDWGHFGHITIGRAKRPLMAFVMVLSFSRKIFLHFYLHQRMANFLRGHEAAFKAWDGVPRVCLYDNLKSAVLERQGDAIHFHPTLLEFAGHYRFEPRPVAVARGNEKGRVERAIRYVRDNFFAAREWKDIEDLNQQATVWCESQATSRRCPEDQRLLVGEVFAQEHPLLLKRPDNPFPTEEHEAVSIGKTPYARFDLNDYSVPHTCVRRVLTVHATLDKVFILDGATILAEHPRSYDKDQQVEQEQHIHALVAAKKQARQHRGQDRIIQAVPLSASLLTRAAQRGYHLGSLVARLLDFLNQYGAHELDIAVGEALARDVPHLNAIRLALDRRRQERNEPPPLALELPNDQRVRQLVVRPHALTHYDQLQQPLTEKNNDDN